MRVAFNSPARNQVWESRSTGGPLACNQQMGVRFPPLPPIVTVAEWLRRQTVDLSTRVQFPPVTPVMRASFNGKNTSVLTKKRRFDSGRLFQVCGRSSAELERGSPKPEAAGSIPAAHPKFCNSGTGHRFLWPVQAHRRRRTTIVCATTPVVSNSGTREMD